MTEKIYTERQNKPVIETIINTAAIALTATGVGWVTNNLSHHGLGFVLILSGVGLEWFKYYGRHKKLW